MKNQNIEELIINDLKSKYGDTCCWIGMVGEDIVMIYSLAFHSALLINPVPTGGYEQRYCYHNRDIALKAISEAKVSGKYRYWKKDHSKNISVDCGNLLFSEGTRHIEGNEIGKVDWDISSYETKYPYPPQFFG